MTRIRSRRARVPPLEGYSDPGCPVCLADVLQIFAGFEPDRAPGRNADFLAGPRVAADAALARLHLEDPESAQLDALAALHGDSHRVEDGVDCHLGFDFGDVGNLRHFVHDVDLDHASGLLTAWKYH